MQCASNMYNSSLRIGQRAHGFPNNDLTLPSDLHILPNHQIHPPLNKTSQEASSKSQETNLTHRPQKVILLDQLPPPIPHRLRQRAPRLARLHRPLQTAVPARQVHALLVHRHLGHQALRVLRGALAQDLCRALALLLRLG